MQTTFAHLNNTYFALTANAAANGNAGTPAVNARAALYDDSAPGENLIADAPWVTTDASVI